MRIFVFSDTHGQTSGMRRVLDAIGGADAVLHAGDVLRDAQWLESYCRCPVYCVRGNNDFSFDAPLLLHVELEGRRLLLAHGHTLRVKQGTEGIAAAAREAGADIAVFGHTHEPLNRSVPGVHLLNPGSMMHVDPRLNSFGLIELEGERIGIDILYESNFR